MAKQKADVESGAGVFAAIVTSLVTKVQERGGDVGADFHRLAKPEGISVLDKIAELIVEAGQAAKNSFRVTVDYGLSLADMIATGKYDWKNGDINSGNFPIEGKDKVDVNVELVHFGRNMDDGEVTVELKRMGYRDATLPELLALGAKFPDKQRAFPIIARGSVWRSRIGSRRVACLGGDGSERGLDLGWLDGGWGGGCRFAVVRK